MKKVIFFILIMVLCFTSTTVAFASDNNSQSIEEKSEDIISVETYMYTDNPSSDSEIQPYLTIEGPDGISRLDYMFTANAIKWEVKPDTALPYIFEGEITITKAWDGSYVDSYDLSKMGFGWEGDIIELDGIPNGRYIATLTGCAITIPESVPYYVSTEARLPFTI